MQTHGQNSGYQEANKRTVGLALWTLAWVATLALAKFGPAYLWASEIASGAAVIANIAVGIAWIVAHAHFLRGIDELQRKITLEALAIALGVGWVGGFAYVVADSAELIEYNVDIGLLPAVIGVVYIVAIVVGNLRYR